jgi:hypothetical protein
VSASTRASASSLVEELIAKRSQKKLNKKKTLKRDIFNSKARNPL